MMVLEIPQAKEELLFESWDLALNSVKCKWIPLLQILDFEFANSDLCILEIENYDEIKVGWSKFHLNYKGQID